MIDLPWVDAVILLMAPLGAGGLDSNSSSAQSAAEP